jgi:hypothetical protein
VACLRTVAPQARRWAGRASFFLRGASRLGFPYTCSRSVLRRLAPFAWRYCRALITRR